jgi:hypothetical protein
MMRYYLIAAALLGMTLVAQPTAALGPNDCDDPDFCICITDLDAPCKDNAPAHFYYHSNSGALNVTICVKASTEPLCSGVNELSLPATR